MLSAEPKADFDNTLTETLIIQDITKTESNNCFIIHCFEIDNDKINGTDSVTLTLGNHALRAQRTD